MTDAHDDVFAPQVPTDEQRRLAAEAGWPDGLLERVVALRWPAWRIELYLGFRGFPSVEMIDKEIQDRERLANGLTVHEATWEDDDRVSDLFANSAERIGEWDVTVERSPNPFAQLRVQENGHMKVIVDRGVAVASSSFSGRSSLVGGERLSVGWMGGWRVRNGMRRLGYANMLMSTPGSAASVFGMLSYWYVRVENENALGFIDHRVEGFAEGTEGHRVVDKLVVEVHHLSAAADPNRTSDPRVRPMHREDVAACCELINGTHDGLDLFRPYTPAWLENRLDDLYWGPKPSFYNAVYGWDDMYVVEDGGHVVACAGLWDRGRDVRERWRNRETGTELTVDSTCVMDFGYASGQQDAAVGLVGYLLGRTAELGRSTMAISLATQPELHQALVWADPKPEHRYLETMGFADGTTRIEAKITRPYTDLAYW